MTYTLEGSIVIAPPLNFAEIRTAQETALKLLRHNSLSSKHASAENVFQGCMSLMLHIEEFERETDEGTLTVRQARVLRPTFESNAKLSYDMSDLVTALIAALPGHAWNGVITAVHEDFANAEKLTVRTGSSVKDKPSVLKSKGVVILRWEDGSPDENLSSRA